MNDTIERSQTHATFVIERTYPVPVEAVWHALSDNDARDQWFGGGDRHSTPTRSRTSSASAGTARRTASGTAGRSPGSMSTYTDIVDLQRIVFTYDMWVDGRHLSTSLTTIALEPDGDQTRLTYTEQGVHFDGLDTVEGREEGTSGPARPARLLPRPRPLRPPHFQSPAKGTNSNDDRDSTDVRLR